MKNLILIFFKKNIKSQYKDKDEKDRVKKRG